jgi:hypothetical protein
MVPVNPELAEKLNDYAKQLRTIFGVEQTYQINPQPLNQEGVIPCASCFKPFFVRHSALGGPYQKAAQRHASPDTTFELAYPDDLGGGAVLSLLEERKALSGLHHILETPALGKKPSRLSARDSMR